MYVLWNTQVGGWLTPGGSYSSELSMAKQHPRDEALALTQRHYNQFMQQYGLIPVLHEDLQHD